MNTKPPFNNPFRDTPFPAAGGEYRADDGELVPAAPPIDLTGLGPRCDAHDAAEAAEAAADPTPPRPARTRRNPAEQE